MLLRLVLVNWCLASVFHNDHIHHPAIIPMIAVLASISMLRCNSSNNCKHIITSIRPVVVAPAVVVAAAAAAVVVVVAQAIVATLCRTTTTLPPILASIITTPVAMVVIITVITTIIIIMDMVITTARRQCRIPRMSYVPYRLQGTYAALNIITKYYRLYRLDNDCMLIHAHSYTKSLSLMARLEVPNVCVF